MHAGFPSSPLAVAELQGLYGAFSFPEKLLQKIWLRGDFDRAAAVTADGRQVRILHPGKWNLLGGPDFTGARLRLADSAEITGDIEVHLRTADWNAHGHARDPAYDRVVLHVVLFPPEASDVTAGGAGNEIPVLALLPLLHRALEEFAADEAVEALANRGIARLPDELGTLPARDLTSLLHRHAAARWRQKVHFARLRVQRLGWDAACHQTALEILGFRFNRAPMLRIAGQWPLANWADGAVAPEEAFANEAEGWSLQGVRPANHPRARLRQYARWTRQRPDWPSHVRALSAGLPALADAVASFGGSSDAVSARDVRDTAAAGVHVGVAKVANVAATATAAAATTASATAAVLAADGSAADGGAPTPVATAGVQFLHPDEHTRDVRRRHRLGALRDRIADEVCGGALGGTRLDNLICDGLLPLLAAETARDFAPIWYHWFPGDLPPLLTGGLRQLGFFDGRAQPACHGAAQGLLGWLLEREARQ